jgi:hypothetical protein
MTLSGGYTFAWSGLLGNNSFLTTGIYRDPYPKAFSDWFAIRQAYGFGVVATDVGVFWSAGVA